MASMTPQFTPDRLREDNTQAAQFAFQAIMAATVKEPAALTSDDEDYSAHNTDVETEDGKIVLRCGCGYTSRFGFEVNIEVMYHDYEQHLYVVNEL